MARSCLVGVYCHMLNSSTTPCDGVENDFLLTETLQKGDWNIWYLIARFSERRARIEN